MNYYTFSLNITLKAPFISQLSGSRRFGLDTALLRNSDDDIVFPGTLIQGVIREKLDLFVDTLKDEKILSQEEIVQWFGPKLDEDEKKEVWEPSRGILSPSQYWVAEKKAALEDDVRYRIKINNNKGTVEKGAYQVIENPFPANTAVAFLGTFSAWLKDDTEADKVLTWLSKAIQYTDAIGALKTVGFGQIEKTDIERSEITEMSKKNVASTICFGLKIKLDRDFCFAQKQTKNAFISKNYIPGAAIIGSIMSRIKRHDDYGENPYPMIKKYIDHFYVTHATPRQEGEIEQRISVIPLSWASDGKKIHDLALKKEPGYFVVDNQFKAPKFQTDWKDHDWQMANKKLGITSQPVKNLAIQTAIDSTTGSAKKGNLFAQEIISSKGFYWLGNVFCVGIKDDKDKSKFQKELSDFFNYPLQNLGKTKAQTTSDLKITQRFELHVESSPIDGFKKENGDYALVICLQSDARLFAFSESVSECNHNDTEQLINSYTDYWQAISKESLVLSHYFAEQYLSGGEYLYKRFNKNSDKPYNPELLTKAGSVFVFNIKQNELELIKSLLYDWCQKGLPQIDDIDDSNYKKWKINPYIAQNGYGQISVNLSYHQESVDNWRLI